MTEPTNIGPPRDSMAEQDCEFALRDGLKRMNGEYSCGRRSSPTSG